MRAHGTRACYVFGPEPGGDRANGCRCDPCTAANRNYARERDRRSRRVAYGIEEAADAYIDAGEVRAHLRWLAGQGLGLRSIARAAHASRTSLQELKTGRRRRVTPAVAERILLVLPVDAADRALIPAGPTWKLLEDLIGHGHTRTSIARELGSTAKHPALQVGRDLVEASTARKVKDLHDRLMLPIVLERKLEAERRRRYRAA